MPSIGPPGSSVPPPGLAPEAQPAPPAPQEPRRSPVMFVVGAGALLVAAAALLLFGGGEDDPDAAARAEIEATLILAMGSDPAQCDTAYTDRFLAENFDSSTQPPVERCREVNDGDNDDAPDTVEVGTVAVASATATATVTVTGGDAGRATMEVQMLRDDGGWRLDDLLDIDLDRDRFIAAQRATTDGEETDLARDFVECIFDYTEAEVTDAELEQGILNGDESYLVDSFGRCRQEFRRSVFAPALIAKSASVSLGEARCIAAAAARAISDANLKRVFRASALDEPMPEWYGRVFRMAAAACVAETRAI